MEKSRDSGDDSGRRLTAALTVFARIYAYVGLCAMLAVGAFLAVFVRRVEPATVWERADALLLVLGLGIFPWFAVWGVALAVCARVTPMAGRGIAAIVGMNVWVLLSAAYPLMARIIWDMSPPGRSGALSNWGLPGVLLALAGPAILVPALAWVAALDVRLWAGGYIAAVGLHGPLARRLQPGETLRFAVAGSLPKVGLDGESAAVRELRRSMVKRVIVAVTSDRRALIIPVRKRPMSEELRPAGILLSATDDSSTDGRRMVVYGLSDGSVIPLETRFPRLVARAQSRTLSEWPPEPPRATPPSGPR